MMSNPFFDHPILNSPYEYGRRAFAEFTEVYQIESDFKKKVETEFGRMIDGVASK